MNRLTLRLSRELKSFSTVKFSSSSDEAYFLNAAKRQMNISKDKTKINFEEFMKHINTRTISNFDYNKEGNNEEVINDSINEHNNNTEHKINEVLRDGNYEHNYNTVFKSKEVNDIFKADSFDITSDENLTKNNGKEKITANSGTKYQTMSFKPNLRDINENEKFQKKEFQKTVSIDSIKNIAKNSNNAKNYKQDQSSANFSDRVQTVSNKETILKFMKLGVNMFMLESHENSLLPTLDWEQDVEPLISILKSQLNLQEKVVAGIISACPAVFKRTVADIENTVDFFKRRGLSSERLGHMVVKQPSILLISQQALAEKFALLETEALLTKDELNNVVFLCPKIAVHPFTKLQNMLQHLNIYTGFSKYEMKHVIMDAAEILVTAKILVSKNFIFLHRNLNLSFLEISMNAKALTVGHTILGKRMNYLKSLNLNVYDPKGESFIPIREIVVGSDDEFCTNVAKTRTKEYLKFIRSSKE